jgi:hypothetical protein
MATIHEVPSDDEVVQALVAMGGHADALQLCQRLMAAGHPELESQLAIQRAAERRRLQVNRDWTLSVPQGAMAA